VIATAVSVAVIPVAWRFAPVIGLLDKPDPRKVHTIPVPRVGGWGIALGALLPIAALLPLDPLMQSYLFGALVLFAFGLWDDARNIGHYKKFFGQFIAVSGMVFYGHLTIERPPFFDYQSVPQGFAIGLTYFAMVGMINAINHSDGLDGLAGGESLLSLIVIAFLASMADGTAAVIICAATIGGILGFLRYNTHPAKVFMGDTGSQFLGFTLGFLAILLTQHIHTALSPALTLMFLGLPIIDIIAVLVQRAYKKMNWFAATRNHIHHRLLDLGFDHYETVVIIYLIQATFMLGAITLRYNSDLLIIGLYLLATVLIFGTLVLLERRGWRAHRESDTSRLTLLIRYFRNHPAVAQVPVWIVSLAVPAYLLAACLAVPAVPRDFAVISAVLAVICIIELFSVRKALSFSVRGSIYVVVLFSLFLAHGGNAYGLLGSTLSFAYFGLLALAIAFAVRYSAEIEFQTTPMDYLILLGVVMIAIGGGRLLEFRELSSVIVKAVILLYGCEVVVEKLRGRWNLLNIVTTLALGILAYKGLH
jgi:UDP-GlcNAc:undecaprenyl-phosphate GlcNAc-1-phosphate transferase